MNNYMRTNTIAPPHTASRGIGRKSRCLLSYIIPVYNGEKYLSKCLDSIINQGLSKDEYEIICADDCSKDSSRNILVNFASICDNIRCLFNERNLKTSSSLNNALEQASGKYIWIIGQDDTIEPKSAAKLLDICETEHLDVLAFNYKRISSNGDLITKDRPFIETRKQDGKLFIRSYFYDTFCIYLLGYEWRAIYNREFLKQHNIVFPKDTIYEDTIFMFNAFWQAKSMRTIEECLYNYRQNEASVTDVTKRYQAFRIFDFFMVSDEVLRFAEGIDDLHIKKQLVDISKRYLKSFTYTITPAIWKEKKIFYSLVKKNWNRIQPNIQLVPLYVRLLLYPKIGLFLTVLLKPLFIIKQMLKKNHYSNN